MANNNSTKDYDDVFIERALSKDQKFEFEAFLYKQKRASLIAGIEIGVGIGFFIIAAYTYLLMVTFSQYNPGQTLSLWEYVFVFSMFGVIMILIGTFEEFHSRSEFQRSLY